MSLININPTTTNSWKELTKHYEEIKDHQMRSLFLQDTDRKRNMSLQFEDLHFDFSKNRMTEETLALLVELAKESKLDDAIEKYFGGDKINVTENRAVLHTALRNNDTDPILVNGQDIMPEVNQTLDKIKGFTEQVISGEFKGYSGKQFTDVVNVGIGGSDLGPNMVVEGLHYYKNHIKTHFVSNIDGDHVVEVLKELNPETTLFVIVSKTFTTQETLTNSETIKKWFAYSRS